MVFSKKSGDHSPVDMAVLISHYLQGFIHPRWLFGISAINSTTLKSLRFEMFYHSLIFALSLGTVTLLGKDVSQHEKVTGTLGH